VCLYSDKSKNHSAARGGKVKGGGGEGKGLRGGGKGKKGMKRDKGTRGWEVEGST